MTGDTVRVLVTLDRRQIVDLLKHVSPPIVYDSKCPLCGAEFVLLPEEGFIMKPNCGPTCAASMLREGYENSLEVKGA